MSALSVDSVARALGGKVQVDGSVRAPGPGHSSKDDTLIVWIDAKAPDGFRVHSHCGDAWPEARDYVCDKLSLPRFNPGNSPNVEYIYKDENSALYIRVSRYYRSGVKSFAQSRWNGTAWVNGVTGLAKIPYRLPELLSDATKPVFICEGEKDADRLKLLSLMGTTSSGGAGKWHESLNQWFHGRVVYVLPDNDEPGRKHADDVARHLSPVAASVHVVSLPDLPEKGDVSDWLNSGGDAAGLLAIAESAPRWAANDNTAPTNDWLTAASLQHKVFPDIRYVVPGYITEGLTLFAGRPKIGKSWLGLDIALAKARGSTCLGDIQCEPGDVLYLALEDNERRLQSRIAKLMPFFPSPMKPVEWPPNLYFKTEWPRADAGGIVKIKEWIDTHPNAQLVIVDVLAMFRPLDKGKNAYEQDYLAIKALQEIASSRNVAIVVITHTRKAQSESGDPFEKVSGTLGLSGAADAVLILDSDSQGKKLYVRARDIEEKESAVMFDKLTCKWRILGEASEVRRSDERKAILSVLTEADEPLAPGKIAVEARMPRNNVDRLLGKMTKEGEVEKIGRGKYIHPDRGELRDSNSLPGTKGKKVREEEQTA